MAELGILDWIAQHCHTAWMDVLMPAITHLGDKGYIWIALGIVILILCKQEQATGAQVMSVRVGATSMREEL